MGWWMIGAAVAFAPPPEWEPSLADWSVERHVFSMPDGLRVVVEHRPSAASVRVVTRIDGGRVAEGVPGAAWHATDLWRGAGVAPSGRDVDTAYALEGAGLSASIGPDAAVLTVEGPASSADTLLGLEAVRLRGAWLSQAPAREPSMPAWADARDGAWLGPLFDAVYPEPHAYHGLYGLESARAEAEAWVVDTWRPENTTVVVSGPVAPRRALCALVGSRACVVDVVTQPVESEALVSADLTAPPAAEARLRMAPLVSAGTTQLQRAAYPVSEPVLLLGWSGPGTDAHLTGLPMQWVVDAGVSWVQRELERALPNDRVRRVRCWWIEGAASGTTVCALFLRHEANTSRVVRMATSAIRPRGLEAHVEAWKRRARASTLSALDSPDALEQLAAHFSRTGRTTFLTDRLDAINAVDAEMLRAMVRAVYVPGRAGRVLVEDGRTVR